MKKLLSRTGIFLFLLFIAIVSMGPFLWVFLASFKTNREILSFSIGFPSGIHFKNYATAFKIAPIPKYYVNSLIVTFFGVILNLIIVGLAAYVLSRFMFKGQKLIRTMFSFGLLVPSAALLLPLYTSISRIGLYNRYGGLILVYIGFGTTQTLFILSSYFKTIPREMEESAYMDGSGFLTTLVRIILPLARPAFATAGIMQFLLCWNEFQFALTLTTGHEARTLPIALYYFKSAFASDYGAMFAAIILVSIPSIVVYIFSQKLVVNGLVAGSVKG